MDASSKRNKKTRITGLLDNIIPHEKRLGDVPLTKYFTHTCDDFMSMSHQVTQDLKQFSDTPCRYSPHPVYDHYGNGVTKEEAAKKLGLDPNGRLSALLWTYPQIQRLRFTS
ncbi:MAG: hypothetical protein IPO63_12380 [Bacteroidetes bacterium]|nr:hypothetical protein [Bacteroidota bacterium]